MTALAWSRRNGEKVAHRLVLDAAQLVWVVAALGVVLRIARFLDNRSLWLDEAFLAINLTDKSFSDLFGRLEFLQSAPVGFLLAEKGVVTLLGDSEYSLRLIPLLASIASLALFAYVARRLLTPPVALLATAFFAVSPRLLYFSSEVKPYSSDVAVALLLLALALRANDERERRPFARLLPLALIAPVAVWISFPAILVLGAVAVSLAIGPLLARDWRQIAVLGGLAAVWLASFGALYTVASTNVSRTEDALFGGGGSHGNRVADVLEKAWSNFYDPAGFQNGTNGLAALLFVVGLLALGRDRRLERIALLGGPLVLAMFAELLGKYPLGGRFSLFLVPTIVLLVGVGLGEAVAASRRPLMVGSLLAFFLLAPAVGQAAMDLASPPRDEDLRPLLGHASRNWRPGDTLYVYRNAQYAARYYGSCEDCDPPGDSYPWPTRPARPSADGEEFAPALLSAPPRLVVGSQNRTPTETATDVSRLPAGRVWLLFSHVSKPRGLNEESLTLAALDERGQRLEERVTSNAALYLYDLS
jgi:hypothetical protein